MRNYKEEIEKLSREKAELTLKKEDKAAQLQSVIREEKEERSEEKERKILISCKQSRQTHSYKRLSCNYYRRRV